MGGMGYFIAERKTLMLICGSGEYVAVNTTNIAEDWNFHSKFNPYSANV
jgi:hypothetical protein